MNWKTLRNNKKCFIAEAEINGVTYLATIDWGVPPDYAVIGRYRKLPNNKIVVESIGKLTQISIDDEARKRQIIDEILNFKLDGKENHEDNGAY